MEEYYFALHSDDKRVKQLLRNWWRLDRNTRNFTDVEKVEKLAGSVFIYKWTREVAGIISYAKGNEREKLRVFEIKELTRDEINRHANVSFLRRQRKGLLSDSV